MKSLLFFFCILFTAKGFAQEPGAQTITGSGGKQNDSISRNKNIYFKSRPDTGIDKNILPYNGMPNAFVRKNPPDIYEGNNGQGQDIYRSQVDNMAILKPDSSFNSGMFTGNFRILIPSMSFPERQKIPPVWVKPKPQPKMPFKN
jgi:hypothetical protein